MPDDPAEMTAEERMAWSRYFRALASRTVSAPATADASEHFIRRAEQFERPGPQGAN